MSKTGWLLIECVRCERLWVVQDFQFASSSPALFYLEGKTPERMVFSLRINIELRVTARNISPRAGDLIELPAEMFVFPTNLNSEDQLHISLDAFNVDVAKHMDGSI